MEKDSRENDILAVDMRHIWKGFPKVIANSDISFSVKKGEIHAIVGENGAGKSTLMKILYGLYSPDRGETFIFGKKIKEYSPKIAIQLGIGMVHQHFMLIPTLTVAENVVLGQEPRISLLFDKKKAINSVKYLSEKFGLFVDPEEKIENLSVGLEQRVEIIKVLYRGAEILILDEPTAVLTPQEVEELYRILRNLKDQGKTIIFITHKLKEVIEISDRVTVMRRGKIVGSMNTADTSKEKLAYMMVGREVILDLPKDVPKFGKKVLEVKNVWALGNKKLPLLKGISFSIREGEIFGIAGVEGNGQNELVEVLTGLRSVSYGDFYIMEEKVTNYSPRALFNKGIAHIPEDRQRRGLILDYSVKENLILGLHNDHNFSGKIQMKFDAILKRSDELIKAFDIRPTDREILAKGLSGGNQQKLIVARELSRNPILLIAAQPTRGVDIGAIEFIYRKILEERKKGKAILLVSSELSEILSLSDTIGVMFEGRMVGIVDAKSTTEKELGLMMTGSIS